MDSKMKEYRTKHKKCKWCKFYKYYTYQECHWATAYGNCELKDKIIDFEDLPRLCKYYELKECGNEIQTNQPN